ncbi:hypothetical protein SGPA1_30931 [Streptomyces misionensis JCM 4497]
MLCAAAAGAHEPVNVPPGAFRLAAPRGDGSRLRVSAGIAPAFPRTGVMTTPPLYRQPHGPRGVAVGTRPR